ncbi:hypothetical protein KFE98_01425 [bacterium SCSIO 12741]|nr:hypothetical protein KFE98_01425 [bacterium SCSIO 12741]
MKPISVAFVFLLALTLFAQCKKEEETNPECSSEVLDRKSSFFGNFQRTYNSVSSQEAIGPVSVHYCGTSVKVRVDTFDLIQLHDMDSSKKRLFYTLIFGPYEGLDDYEFGLLRPFDSVRFPVSAIDIHMADSMIFNDRNYIDPDQKAWVIRHKSYTEFQFEKRLRGSREEEEFHSLMVQSNYPFF